MYGKLFAQMFDGTLATRGPWQALVTFQQFIILSDRQGHVDMTPEAISRRTTIPLEIITQGIEALEQPDPHSRTPDEDGRRIIRLSDSRPWGWRIINHAKYRAIRSQEERREYHRSYWREKRSPTAKPTQLDSTNSTNSSKQEAVCKKQKKLDSTEPCADSSPAFIVIPLVGKQGNHPITEQQVREWEEAYPGVKVRQELRQIREWNLANPGRRKTSKGIVNHIVGWLGKEQDRRPNAAPQAVRPKELLCQVETEPGHRCGMPGTLRGGGAVRCDHHDLRLQEQTRRPIPENFRAKIDSFLKKSGTTTAAVTAENM